MANGPLIPPNWQLPIEFRRRLGRSAGRQRLMNHEGQLLIVTHDVPGPDEDSRQGILFWFDSESQWKSSNGEPGAVAIENLLSKYEKRIEGLDQAEFKAKISEDYLPVLEQLAPISRSIRNLRDVLQDARKAAPDLVELIDFRDRAYALSRTAELTYQYAKDSMDVAIVKRAEEQASASDRMSAAAHRLNIMAALFFPLATLSGVFGTTLTDGWSWAKTADPFIVFLAVGLVSGIVLTYFVGSEQKSPPK